MVVSTGFRCGDRESRAQRARAQNGISLSPIQECLPTASALSIACLAKSPGKPVVCSIRPPRFQWFILEHGVQVDPEALFPLRTSDDYRLRPPAVDDDADLGTRLYLAT